MSYPPPFIVEPPPGHQHTHSVILLHGRSSTAREFATDLFALKTSNSQILPACFPGFRWVFPDAGERWCTPYKEKRSAWCDTFSLEDLSERQDLQVAGLRDGILHVKCIVEDEVEKLGGRPDRIILGGFSQGSAIALWSLFTGAAMMKGSLGAFVGLSAWMPFTTEAKKAVGVGKYDQSQIVGVEQLKTTFLEILGLNPLGYVKAMREGLTTMPVYLGHGTDDIPVSVTNCHELTGIFQALEAEVEVCEYVGAERDGHWVKEPEQLDDVVTFLRKQTSKAGDV